MAFTKLTDKQKKQLQKHKEKYGSRHYNVMKAHMMRGKDTKEAHKIAQDRVPTLPERKKRMKKVKNLTIEPLEPQPVEEAVE